MQAQDAAATCCIDGEKPPPGLRSSAMLSIILTFFIGVFKIGGASAASCCAGQPTTSKLKCAMWLLGFAVLLDFV